MSNSFTDLHHLLIQLSEPIAESLAKTNYAPPEGSQISVKALIEPLLPHKASPPNPNVDASIKDFALACALLSSSHSSTHDLFSWIPENLSTSANSAFRELSKAYCVAFGERNAKRIGELGLDCGSVPEEKRLVVELMPEVMPLLKERIKESSIDKSDEAGDEVSAASARVPVGFAIVAAYQFRWFATQVDYPHLGKLCALVIPCALNALDHWSPDVKGQGMISFIHLAKNVNAVELGSYGDVILDACCQNIASSDEIWHHVVEMSTLLVTCIQSGNPRSPWFERMLNEMLSHLERQPRDKERCVAWLKYIEPLLSAVGLVLLAHFRRIFPLILKWMHADDDETVLLVLERIQTILKLTWIRNTPYVGRLVDELTILYKEAAMKRAREEVRMHILQILILLQQCKGMQFEAAWGKHKDDPNLANLESSLSGRGAATVKTMLFITAHL
ncbi:uncharacterized protein At2g39910 isoform X1 [Quercus robur]|uniref:uncharacterized protein At2g39910 isoform X1 n=1 Tax=Quercus robur TaxID=38942 RepID=UPI0021614990|nr:uncharacterized protein At2g39910 isoform X1 [Quercus robur]